MITSVTQIKSLQFRNDSLFLVYIITFSDLHFTKNLTLILYTDFDPLNVDVMQQNFSRMGTTHLDGHD